MVESIRQTVEIRDPDTGQLIGTVEEFILRKDLPDGRIWNYRCLYPPTLVEDLGEAKIWEFVEQEAQEAEESK